MYIIEGKWIHLFIGVCSYDGRKGAVKAWERRDQLVERQHARYRRAMAVFLQC